MASPRSTSRRFLAGRSTDGKTIVAGEFVFALMDTHGVPLETINDILAAREMGFDVQGFVNAALKSGNWKPDRLKARLLLAYEGPDRDAVETRLTALLGGAP